MGDFSLKLNSFLEEARELSKEFLNEMNEVGKVIREAESVLCSFPLDEYKYHIDEESYFLWKNKRICFGNKEMEKPFIETKVTIRHKNKEILNDFLLECLKEFKKIIKKENL